MPLTRTDLQQLADVRLTEANALLAAGLWDGAYYLAGYAVECALKACIMAYVERTGVIFEDRKFSEKCWTHDPKVLVELAELEDARKATAAADPQFNRCWLIVRVWKETSRYARTPEAQAREFVEAINHPAHGVLTWIRRHW